MTPRIVVLLATLDGMPWVREQVEGILGQEGVEVRVVVSDDGSTDGTAEYLAGLAAANAPVTGTSTNGSFSRSPSTRAGRKFMGGDPMNPATNRLTGCSYSSRGLAHCCRTPFFRTATRSPRVMASVWSWVT